MPNNKDLPSIRTLLSDIAFPGAEPSNNGTASTFPSRIPAPIESNMRFTANVGRATNAPPIAKPPSQRSASTNPPTPAKTPLEPATSPNTLATVAIYARAAAESMATGTQTSAKPPSPGPSGTHHLTPAKRSLYQVGDAPRAKRPSPRTSGEPPTELAATQSVGVLLPSQINSPTDSRPPLDHLSGPAETQVERQRIYHQHRLPQKATPPSRRPKQGLPTVPIESQAAEATASRPGPSVYRTSSRAPISSAQGLEALAGAPPPDSFAPKAQQSEYMAPDRSDSTFFSGTIRYLKSDPDAQFQTKIELPFSYDCDGCGNPIPCGTHMDAIRHKAMLQSTSDGPELPCAFYAIANACRNCSNSLEFATNPFDLVYTVRKGCRAGTVYFPAQWMYLTASDVFAARIESPLYGRNIWPLGDLNGIHGIELSVYLQKLQREGR